MPIDTSFLQKYIDIAGNDNSIGYVQKQGTDVTKAAAHRHLTGKNAGELAHVTKNMSDNAILRANIFTAITKALGRDVNLRADVLQFAARQLGLTMQADGQYRVEDCTQATPLPRRTLRNLLRVVQNENLHIFATTDPSDASRSGASQTRRQAMLTTLRENFQGINWDKLPLESLTNYSLREMGKGLMSGTIQPGNDLRAFVMMSARRDLINTETSLQQIQHLKDLNPQQVRDKVELPTDRIEAPKAEAPKAEPKKDYAPKRAPVQAGQFDGTLGRMKLLMQGAAEKLRLDAIMKSTDGTLSNTMRALSGAIRQALCEPDAAKSAAAIRAAVAGNLDAVTLLVCQSEALTEKLGDLGILKNLLTNINEALPGFAKDMGFTTAQINATNQGAVRLLLEAQLAEEGPELLEEMVRPEQITEIRRDIIEAVGDESLVSVGLIVADAKPEQIRLEAVAENKNGEIRKLVTALTDGIREALIEPDPQRSAEALRAVITGNLDAVTLLACQPALVKEKAGGLGLAQNLLTMMQKALPEIAQSLGQSVEDISAANQGVIRLLLESVLTEKNGAILADMIRADDIAAVKATLTETIGELSQLRDLPQIAARLSTVSEAQVRDFLADLVLNKDSAKFDTLSPADRIRATLTEHADAIAALLCNREKFMETLSGPARMMADQVLSGFDAMLGDDAKALLSPDNAALVRLALAHKLSETDSQTLAQIDAQMHQGTQQALSFIQEYADRNFKQMLDGAKPAAVGEAYGAESAELEQALEAFNQAIAGYPAREQVELRQIGLFLLQTRAVSRPFDLNDTREPQPQGNNLAAFVQEMDGVFADYCTTLPYSEDFLNEMTAAFSDTVTHAPGFAKSEFAVAVSKGSPAALAVGIRNFVHAYVAQHPERAVPVETEAQAKTKREQIDAVAAQTRAIHDAELGKLAGDGSSNSEKGFGRFMVEVMKDYFAGVDPIDQRSMLASLIRFGSEEKILDSDSEEVRERKETDNNARQLGALFKGAGPIMQKLLQQLGSTSVAPEFRAALEDMKCNLAPMSDDVIRSKLLAIVENSEGNIQKITVQKSLGAASVGQSLLCTLTAADGSTREVVIKLLRPDAALRMEREKEVFLRAADKVPGMRDTYMGRLERLEEELDLRLEAAHVQVGSLYDTPAVIGGNSYHDVHTMRLDPSAAVAKDAMVLERAPGDTLANYLRDTAGRIRDLQAKAGNAALSKLEKLEVYRELQEIREELKNHQASLLHLSYKWVEEGLFKAGFYHGDLHAGNIMIDTAKEGNQGITLIDFGNATQLTDREQSLVMRMIFAATKNRANLFLESYRELMKPAGHERFDMLRGAIRPQIALIFSKEDSQAIGNRISAALQHMQNLGLELPAAIFNFSQCQMMLQGTIDSMNNSIGSVTTALTDLEADLRLNDRITYTLDKMAPLFTEGNFQKTVEEFDRLAYLCSGYDGKISTALQELQQFQENPANAHFGEEDKNGNIPVIPWESLPATLVTVFKAVLPNAQPTTAELLNLQGKLEAFSRDMQGFAAAWNEIRAQHTDPKEIMQIIQENNTLQTSLTTTQRALRQANNQLKSIDSNLAALSEMPDDTRLVRDEPNPSKTLRDKLNLNKEMSRDELLAVLEPASGVLQDEIEALTAKVSTVPEDWVFRANPQQAGGPLEVSQLMREKLGLDSDMSRDEFAAVLQQAAKSVGKKLSFAKEAADLAAKVKIMPQDWVFRPGLRTGKDTGVFKELIPEGGITAAQLRAKLQAQRPEAEKTVALEQEKLNEYNKTFVAFTTSPMLRVMEYYKAAVNGVVVTAGADNIHYSVNREDAPETFVDTMGTVVQDHMSRLTKSVGFLNLAASKIPLFSERVPSFAPEPAAEPVGEEAPGEEAPAG